MTVSLLNVLVADKVNALLDDPHVRDNLPDDQRGFTREQATAIIHAALWAYAARAGSTAEAYARMGLFEAIGLKTWSFKEPEQPAPETGPAPIVDIELLWNCANREQKSAWAEDAGLLRRSAFARDLPHWSALPEDWRPKLVPHVRPAANR